MVVASEKCIFSCSKRLIQVHLKPLQAVQTKRLCLKGETCSFYADLRRREAKLPSQKRVARHRKALSSHFSCTTACQAKASSVMHTLDREGRCFGWGSERSRVSCVDWKDHCWTERMDASYHPLKEQGFLFFRLH